MEEVLYLFYTKEHFVKMNQTNVEVISNATAEKTSFTISDKAEDVRLAVSIITDKFYRYKLLTPIREYICNARDAHREIGQARQIEITAPTVFDPVFKVRDFGPGISPELMNTVFIKFFASTKRRDNKQTGGFGLGAKSAFAMSDSFGIVSITNGVKRSYTAYKAADGTLQPESEEATTEPNGVEISIPVKPNDIAEAKRAIKLAVYFWKESERPLVKNMEMTYPQDPILHDRLAFYKSSELEFIGQSSSQDFIIMDGIVYNISGEDKKQIGHDELMQWNRKVKNFALICETGELSVTPSRENLEFNEHTVKTLNLLVSRGFKTVKSSFAKEMNSIKLTKGFIQKKIEVIKKYNPTLQIEEDKINDNLSLVPSYSGNEIKLKLVFSKKQWNSFSFKQYTHSKFKEVMSQKYMNEQAQSHTMDFSESDAFFLYDSKKDSDSEAKRRTKISAFAEKNKGKRVYLLGFPDAEKLQKDVISSVVTFTCTSTVTYEKPEKGSSTRGAVRTVLSFSKVISNYETVQVERNDDPVENLVYVISSEYRAESYSMTNVARYLATRGQTLISVNKTDEKLMARKSIPQLKEYIKSIVPTERDLHMTLRDCESHHVIEKSLPVLEDCFKNKKVKAYLEQQSKMNKCRESQDIRFDHLTAVTSVFQKDANYQKMLQIKEDGFNMIRDNFSLILSVKPEMVKDLKEELEVYIKNKEKGVK